jgi:hypothetical protein
MRWGVIVDDGQAAEVVGVRGKGCCRGSLSSWSPWINAWRSCEGATGVRGVRGLPAVRNLEGGASHRRRLRVQFRHGQGSGLREKLRKASWRRGGATADLGQS